TRCYRDWSSDVCSSDLFKTATRAAEVAIALVTQSDFKLQPGQVTETVEVSDATPLVETSEERLSTLFIDRQVADLPNNGRDFNKIGRASCRESVCHSVG